MAKDVLVEPVLVAEQWRTRQVIASQALEGLETPPEEERMLMRLGTGGTSFAEYEQWAKGTYIGGS